MKYFHIGGDEVNDQCWSESKNIIEWTKQMNIGINEITKYFESKIIDMIYEFGKVPIVWQGILDASNMPSSNDNMQKWKKSWNNHYDNNRSSSSSSSSSSSGYNKGHFNQRELRDINNNNNNKDADIVNDDADNDDNDEEVENVIVQPWKCWGGLALRSMNQALSSKHPVIMSACWYLDYNQDWSSYLATDLIASARASIVDQQQMSPSSSQSSSSTTTAPHDSSKVTYESIQNLTEVQRLFLISSLCSSVTMTDKTSSSSSSSGNDAEKNYDNIYPEYQSNYYIKGGEASIWTGIQII